MLRQCKSYLFKTHLPNPFLNKKLFRAFSKNKNSVKSKMLSSEDHYKVLTLVNTMMQATIIEYSYKCTTADWKENER